MNIREKLPTYISTEIYGHLRAIKKLANDRNQKIALVGGVIRDVLLGRTVLDADVMLESPVKPIIDQLEKTPNVSIVSHERFLTFSVHFRPGVKIDVVTAREETYAAPAQLPVVKPTTILADLRRRDFTINAMACWLTEKEEGELLDPFFGRDDLSHKVIRVLHAKSFVDDPTRIFRAARFAGRLGFAIEVQTEKGILDSIAAGVPSLLSPVRRRHEFDLVLKEENPALALELLERWGAIALVHAEWKNCPPSLLAVLARRPPDKLPVPLLTWRWALWFKPWGSDKANKMMTDLAFEKDLKRDILSLL